MNLTRYRAWLYAFACRIFYALEKLKRFVR